jgi:O-antigen ligase
VFWWAWDHHHLWSGRKEWWTVGLRVWWKNPWPLRLIGLGPNAWQIFARNAAGRFAGDPIHTKLDMMHAHNDYLQILFERGLLAFVALLGFLGSTLWTLAHAGADGQALFLVGCVLCAVAFCSFPWTGYVLIYKPKEEYLLGYGAPTLNYISWLMVMLVEVVK